MRGLVRPTQLERAQRQGLQPEQPHGDPRLYLAGGQNEALDRLQRGSLEVAKQVMVVRVAE